jgi:cytochrome c556
MRGFLVAVALLLAPVALSAPPTPVQIVKYRKAVMDANGGHMRALAMIVKGESDRTGDSLMHATALHDLAKTVGALFPEGTGPGNAAFQTEAKPEIWTQKDKFAALVKTFETESGKLVDAVKKNDAAAIKAAFGATGGACGDCHDAFKVDEEHHD